MKVYDTFMISNELDMALTRMHILRDVVDYHVVCEAHETHSGGPKSLNFADNPAMFDEFKSKIIYVYVPALSNGQRDSWQREQFHRHNIARGLVDAMQDDLVIVSDCDEIPNPDCVADWKASGKPCAEFSWNKDFYYYKLNFHIASGEGWSFGGCRRDVQPDPNGIKSGAFAPEFKFKMARYERGAWHFSYFHSPQGVRDKLKMFMHHDIADKDARLSDTEYIAQAIKQGTDLFKEAMGRAMVIDRVPIEPTLPKYILDHLEDYRQWIVS